MILPVPGGVVTRRDDPQTPADERLHAGNAIDVGARLGDPVLALHGGRVVGVSCEAGYGQLVRLQNEQWRSLYAHLAMPTVKEGATVLRGQMIGRVGSTGQSTGPHVHVALRDLHTDALVDPRGLFLHCGGML